MIMKNPPLFSMRIADGPAAFSNPNPPGQFSVEASEFSGIVAVGFS
jgi:hypothetical protein